LVQLPLKNGIAEMPTGFIAGAKMKRIISLATVLIVSLGWGVVPASANSSQISPFDNYTPFWSYDEFDVEHVEFGQSEIPGRLDFYVHVAGPISWNSYTLGDYIGVSIDIDLDGEPDYTMSINEEYLDRRWATSTEVYDVKRDNFVSGCDAEFWHGDYVVAFDLKASCLNLPSRFGIMGYAYTSTWDDTWGELDIVPDINHFQVAYSGGNTQSSATRKVTSNPPTVQLGKSFRVSDPGVSPNDLVALAAKVSKGVVTLYCGNAQGTGWSAKVELSQSMKNSGTRSYIITNHHVVSDCLQGQNVEVVASNGTRYSGQVVGYDEQTDVAAITTSGLIPQLEWRGEKPAVGWWVGVSGSPFNNQGSLATGIVSSISAKEFVTSAPLNPGNSGGPVFDRDGRVIGIATAILTNSNLIGFAGSTQNMCAILVSCGGASAWIEPGSLVSAPVNEAVNTGAQGPVDGEFSAWTKVLANGKQMKFYVKYPQVGDKIQFMLQDKSGKYQQVAWTRITAADLGVDGSYVGLTNDIYFIRTVNLKPGKNRVQVRVNDQIVWGTKTYSLK
jgi:S1-C subfamily serine protease